MTTESQSPLSETEKRVAFLAELRAERERRISAGKWSGSPRVMLTAHIDNADYANGVHRNPLLLEEAAKRKALCEHIDNHPDPNVPKMIEAYDWIFRVVIDPKPQVELPSEQYAPNHADAIDVTPRRPPPSPPPSSARSLAPPRMLDPRNVNIPRDVAAAERRRTQRFMDDEWGSPAEHPLRYPRGNRSGW